MQFRDEHQNGKVGRSIVKNDNNNSHKSLMSFIQDSNKADFPEPPGECRRIHGGETGRDIDCRPKSGSNRSPLFQR